MSARLADDELLITRTFDAPASVLFAVWSKPEHMKRWMGPTGFTCPVAEIDFRVGGAYRATRHFTMFARIENIGDADYMEPLGYLAWKRSARAGVKVGF